MIWCIGILSHLSVSPNPKPSGISVNLQGKGEYIANMGEERCTLYTGLDSHTSEEAIITSNAPKKLLDIFRSIDYFSEFKETSNKGDYNIEDGGYLLIFRSICKTS